MQSKIPIELPHPKHQTEQNLKVNSYKLKFTVSFRSILDSRVPRSNPVISSKPRPEHICNGV